MLVISCSNEEKPSTTPQATDPRLPNQENFKPAIQLVPKAVTAKSTGKSTETKQQRLVKELVFDVVTDDNGAEIHENFTDRRYTYDAKGRLHSVDKYIDGQLFKNITKFDFDDAHKVTNTYYADIVAEINSGGYISKVTAPSGTVTDIFYDEIGRDVKETEKGTYTQIIQELQPDGSYEAVSVTKPKTATYLYSYVDNKVFVNIVTTQQNYAKRVTTNGVISYTFADRVVETTYELTVDYTKAGVYSSEPIFRCYIYNWMHILDWKIKAVSEGTTMYELHYEYDYKYDTNGYLTESNLKITDLSAPSEQTLTRTLYTYE
ncbi:hypothetical protein DCO46_11555 [Flavobacterium sp. HTF]|nr:hypothetical protein DCO46_11555 [Flavobacterium sp. HTF]